MTEITKKYTYQLQKTSQAMLDRADELLVMKESYERVALATLEPAYKRQLFSRSATIDQCQL